MPLGGQNVLADLQHLAVGSGGSSAADGLAVQCVIVDGRIVAVGGVLDDGDDSALVVFIHEVLDLLALQSSHESLDLRLVLVALLADQHVDVSRRAVLHGQSVGHGVQTSGDGVVGVDDCVVLVLQDVGHLSSLDLIDGDVQGFSSMSFLVAVRPASAFSLKKPFFSSRVRARASLVVSLGTATLILSSFAAAEAASEEAAPEAAELAVEGRAAAGSQGGSSTL